MPIVIYWLNWIDIARIQTYNGNGNRNVGGGGGGGVHVRSEPPKWVH